MVLNSESGCDQCQDFSITPPATPHFNQLRKRPHDNSTAVPMIPQSSNPVSAVLPAGAYVIRNRQALTVLHIPPPDTDIQDLNILANGQNEDQFKDQQIWWIEPLADYVGPGAEKGVLYSITSPSSGRSLCVNPKSGTPYIPPISWALVTSRLEQVASLLIYPMGSPGTGGGCERWMIQRTGRDFTRSRVQYQVLTRGQGGIVQYHQCHGRRSARYR